LLITIIAILDFTGVASAALSKIGTANYLTIDYNLIYEDTKGLVWLDYVKASNSWQNQVDWASGLGGALDVIIDPGYTTTIDWTTGWRLPITDESKAKMSGGFGYEGLNSSGNYNYKYGYNMVNSELGHLYYESLGNLALIGTDGTNPQPDWGLKSTGPFDNLQDIIYWSGTEFSPDTIYSWLFGFYDGRLDGAPKVGPSTFNAIAVRTGEVSAVPVPGTMLLLASGLAGISACRKMKWRRHR